MIKPVFISCLLLLLLLSGCNSNSNSDEDQYLAEVNGEVLSLKTFKAIVGEEAWENLRPEQKRRYVEDWVNLTLLAQAAEAQQLDRDPIVKERISYAQKKVKANALIAANLAKINISEDQLFSYFKIHQNDFRKAIMTYEIQRIALPDKLTAEKILQRINQGLDFNIAQKRYSIDELRSQNGMMGYVEPASADSLFWQTASKLEPLHPALVKNNEVWYIIRYTDSKQGDYQPSFEAHREEIKQRIITEKQEEIYQELLKEIKSQNNKIYYY